MTKESEEYKRICSEFMSSINNKRVPEAIDLLKKHSYFIISMMGPTDMETAYMEIRLRAGEKEASYFRNLVLDRQNRMISRFSEIDQLVSDSEAAQLEQSLMELDGPHRKILEEMGEQGNE